MRPPRTSNIKNRSGGSRGDVRKSRRMNEPRFIRGHERTTLHCAGPSPPMGPGHVRHSEGVRAKSEPGGAELPRRGRFGDSADNDAVRSLGLDPAGAHRRPGMNCGLQGRLGTVQYSTAPWIGHWNFIWRCLFVPTR